MVGKVDARQPGGGLEALHGQPGHSPVPSGKAPPKRPVAKFLGHRHVVAPAAVDEFQRPYRILLRAPAVVVVPQHFERHHAAYRHAGCPQGSRVHVAAHVCRAKKRRLLQRIGHQLDAVRQAGLLAQQAGQLQQGGHAGAVVVGPRLLAAHVVVRPDYQARAGSRAEGAQHVAIGAALHLVGLCPYFMRAGRPQLSGNISGHRVEHGRMLVATRLRCGGEIREVLAQSGGVGSSYGAGLHHLGQRWPPRQQ